MNQSGIEELACSRWLAQVNLRNGSNVQIHIHRASPIDAQGALKLARSAAKFGKVSTVLPIGPCCSLNDDEDS